MSKTLVVRALTVKQNGGIPLYSFFLRADEILSVADISRIEKSASGDLLGYQRGEVQRHVGEIVDYLNSSDVLFPNSIILAMSSSAKFKQSRGPAVGNAGCRAGVLEIPLAQKGPKAGWIVDGQQRTLALGKSKNKKLLVPITAFVSDDFELHRSQFLLVNKVKPLPSGLINELLPEVNTTLPPSLAKNKIPSELCKVLNRDPESPFYGLIVRHTTDRKKNKQAVVADNSLIQVIRTSLNSAHGCLYQYRNVATGETDVESVRRALNLYWSEVQRLFPDAWGLPPLKSRLMHGVGIKSMGILMDRVMGGINPMDKQASVKVRKALKPIEPYCAWTAGHWALLNDLPWNQLQNTSGHVRLLSNMLIRAYAGVK
jgi:DGQHR domain-containing protein